jgi:hypothetical protein
MISCRGGFALVWLGEDKETHDKIACKQILKNNLNDSVKKEIEFGNHFFLDEKRSFMWKQHPGTSSQL